MDTSICAAAPMFSPQALVVIVALALTVLVSTALGIAHRRRAQRELSRHTLVRLHQYRVPLLAEELARFADGARLEEQFAADARAFVRRPHETAEQALVGIA